MDKRKLKEKNKNPRLYRLELNGNVFIIKALTKSQIAKVFKFGSFVRDRYCKQITNNVDRKYDFDCSEIDDSVIKNKKPGVSGRAPKNYNRIPFLSNAKPYLYCPYLEQNTAHSNLYYCTHPDICKKGKKIDCNYRLLEKCCGIFCKKKCADKMEKQIDNYK